jgi:C4-dicarboxylate transporter, DctM subunit
LLTSIMAGYALIKNMKLESGSFDLSEMIIVTKKGVFALFMPILILGGIYSGLFTATESAAVAVFYAVIIELFVHKEMNFNDLQNVIVETSTMLGSLLPLLMMALSINTFLAYEHVPHALVDIIQANVSDQTSFLLMTLVGLLVIGCFVDIGSAILILAPLLAPLALAQGVDLTHFGVIMIVNLELGYLTPPLGLNLIVAMGVFKEDFWVISRAVLPFLVLMFIGLLIVTFWPSLSLFLL